MGFAWAYWLKWDGVEPSSRRRTGWAWGDVNRLVNLILFESADEHKHLHALVAAGFSEEQSVYEIESKRDSPVYVWDDLYV